MRRHLAVLVLGVAPVLAAGLTHAAAAAPHSPSRALQRWQSIITEASQRFGIPKAWIDPVIEAESGGNPRATSPKGAMGLMQIMPRTWAALRLRDRLGDDPYQPHDNIFAGTAYLRQLYDRYGYPDLFAAYNAGPRRFDAYLFHHRPLPDETIGYLARLGQPVFLSPGMPVATPATRLFFPLHGHPHQTANPPQTPGPDGLFVPLKSPPERP